MGFDLKSYLLQKIQRFEELFQTVRGKGGFDLRSYLLQKIHRFEELFQTVRGKGWI